MKNIVQLYFQNKKKVPFIVRRENWHNIYGILITSVKPQKTPNGWFGNVYGYPLPPIDGSETNPFWGVTGKPAKVKNSGSYQWELVSEIPDKWKPFLKDKENVKSK
jgi:hypothetical protein